MDKLRGACLLIFLLYTNYRRAVFSAIAMGAQPYDH